MRAAEETSSSDYIETRFSAADGLILHARIYPPAAGLPEAPTPLVCLPGLTRNARDFHGLAMALSGRATPLSAAAARKVVCFDYRGRGGSARDDNPANYNLAVESDDVLSGLAALGIHRAVFLGTSRGALIIHMLAALRATSIAGVILNDAGPVIEGAGLAQIKSYLTRTPQPKGWDEAAELLQTVHGRAFTSLSKDDWREMARAIYVEKKGKLVADYDPALTRQLEGIDFSTPLPTLWPQFEALTHVPALAIRGENSQLLSAETVEEMERRHPNLTAITVAGHGHAPILHLAALPKAIDAFLGANRL
ncbi:alpha/beta fold hydrolase [Pararhizobium haloflavum]|uniref:alpha/beta fold hydrolase n=1 Tax=Pararhizobium haloflavum TaxID=2037914 RepID=UPI0018E458F7|nr:alpha/beta hydrolase [Pararhizobium haloflavum]